MTAGHRRDAANRLLAEIGKGGQGVGTVVIGTQAIEASLDIDLDAMSTDLAPAPSLIQRAGRVWRHADAERRGVRLPGAAELPLHVVCGETKWAALPYFHSELLRVERFLAGRSRLRMPEDSQAFVEASALRLDEVNWSEQQEMAEYARRFAKADGVVINTAELLDPDADLMMLMRLTGHDVDEETATRLIEPPTATALIIDPDGRTGAPGAWAGTLRSLEKIDSNDRSALRIAMEATVPLNGKLACRALEFRRTIETGNPWKPESRVLQGVTPIVIGQAGLGYDRLLGLIDLDAAE
jgi:CRISPR-associated endonuclease/helicase Cas3